MSDQVFISLDSIGDDSKVDVARGRSLLSITEQARADSFRFVQHQNRYIRGRALLRLKIAKLIARAPEAIVIDEMERGKPFLPDHCLAFNVSHSGDLAIYTFSFTLNRIGVDIETLDRDIDPDQLSTHYFTEGEQRELQNLAPESKLNLFFKIWTAKEARMKLTGEGMYLEPGQIDLIFTNGIPTAYQKPEPTTLCLHINEYPDLNAISAIAADRPFDILPLV